MTERIYTIGHSSHSTEKLVSLLARHGITAIADVRSQPYSRLNPHFKRENLHLNLKMAGISYVFLGRELGGRPQDRSCYVNGTVEYERVAATDLFRDGIRRIIEGSRKHRIALICAEEDPLACHRAVLIARRLVSEGIDVQHIRANGQLESHNEVLDRLLKAVSLLDNDLFTAREALLVEAYQRRGRQIAYTVKPFDQGLR